MIISQILGGLGNQMFQYAAGWAAANARCTTFKLDISGFANYPLHQGFELERVFDIAVDVATSQDLRKVLGWQSNRFFQNILRRPSLAVFRKNAMILEPHFQYSEVIQRASDVGYFAGYWQSEKYFISSRREIRRQFIFRESSSIENRVWESLIMASNSVGFHVRRGDFISQKNINTHGVCSLDYFEAAIRYIFERIPNPEFFFFSDDMAWVKENIRVNAPCHFVENNKGIESFNDMRLMSLCRHNIIANSSFSWWGAWLNAHQDKIVIAPKKWFANGLNTQDLLPESWIAI